MQRPNTLLQELCALHYAKEVVIIIDEPALMGPYWGHLGASRGRGSRRRASRASRSLQCSEGVLGLGFGTGLQGRQDGTVSLDWGRGVSGFEKLLKCKVLAP